MGRIPNQSELIQGSRRVIRAPLALPAAALVAGILAARYVPLPVGVWAAFGAAGLGVLLATLRRAHLRTACIAGACAALLGAGAVRFSELYFSVPKNHVLTFTDDGRRLATLRGRVCTFPEIYRPEVEFGYRPAPRMAFLLQAESLLTGAGQPGASPAWRPASGLVRVSVDDPYGQFRPGDRVEISGWIGRFHPPRNPGQYDPAAAARMSGTWVWMSCPTSECVQVIEPVGVGGVDWLWRLRAALRQHLLESGDLQSGRLLSALILGERSQALDKLNDTMRRTGVAHFLSISGLHLGVFLGFVFLLCRVLWLSPRRSAIVVLVVLAAYLLLAEARPPLLRSAIMAICLLAGVIVGRPGSSLNALALAAIFLLLFDPRQIFQPGFQLSFAIVAGLILLYRPVRRLLFGRWLRRRGLMVFRGDQRRSRWLYFAGANWLIDGVTMCVTAYLVSAPLVAVHFGFFSPWAIVLNVVLFPLVAAILIPGYISMILVLPMPNLAAAIGDLAGLAADGLVRLVDAFRALPLLSITMRPVGVVWAVLCYATILSLLWAPGRRRRGGLGFYGRSNDEGVSNEPRAQACPQGASGYAVSAPWRLRLLRASRFTSNRVLPAVLLVLLAGATVWSQCPARPPCGVTQLDLLAVGNGQCAVLQIPQGRTYLIDAGTRGGFDLNGRVLEPFLRAMRLPTPREAFLSHADSDHFNALPALVDDGTIRKVFLCEYFGRLGKVDFAGAEMLQRMTRHGVEITSLRRGQTIELEPDVKVEVLWPPPDRTDLAPNDTSLVLRISCGRESMLLPGDLAAAGQAELLKDPAQLRSDVLVLPHHGGWAPTLPDFVAAVAPKIVLVSTGREPQGPSTAGNGAIREFYERLRKDYRFYSTARNGWIRVHFGPRGLDVRNRK